MSRVQSIERAFAVLAALTDGPVGVTDVAERADLPKSTAARMLASLAREGAVEQVPGDTRYRLGPRIEALASGLGSAHGLIAIDTMLIPRRLSGRSIAALRPWVSPSIR